MLKFDKQVGADADVSIIFKVKSQEGKWRGCTWPRKTFSLHFLVVWMKKFPYSRKEHFRLKCWFWKTKLFYLLVCCICFLPTQYIFTHLWTQSFIIGFHKKTSCLLWFRFRGFFFNWVKKPIAESLCWYLKISLFNRLPWKNHIWIFQASPACWGP